MISIAGSDAKGRTSWTPVIGEWNGSGLTGVGYTGNSSRSFYTIDNNILTGHAILESLTSWGVSTPNLGEWWMTVPPIAPYNLTTWRPIGYMDHNTYINRGCHAIAELTFQQTTPYVKFLLVQNTTGPLTTLKILSNANWSQYITQFFGGYGAISVQFQYEV